MKAVFLLSLALTLFGCATAPAVPDALPVAERPDIQGTGCPAMAILRVPPKYPRNAMLSGQEGWVLIEVEYSAYGQVISMQSLQASPPGVFEHATEVALSNWRFKASGQPGQCTMVMEFAITKRRPESVL